MQVLPPKVPRGFIENGNRCHSRGGVEPYAPSYSISHTKLSPAKTSRALSRDPSMFALIDRLLAFQKGATTTIAVADTAHYFRWDHGIERKGVQFIT